MGTAARMLGGKKRKKNCVGRFVRFGGPISGSAGSILAQPLCDRTGMMTGRRPVFKTLSKLHRRNRGAAGSDTIFVLIREKTCLSQTSKFNITFISL